MAKFLEGLNTIRKFLLFTVGLMIGIWIWKKWDQIPSVSGWFTAKPVQIDDTPLLIAEIRSIAELHTARLYCEVITDSVVVSETDVMLHTLQNTIPGGSLFPHAMGSKKIVLIAKGRVIAGLDLSGLQQKDFRVHRDSVFVALPPAQIIEVIANPTDFEVFMEEGDWTSAEIVAVKQKAIRKMREEAIRQELTEKANIKAVALMKSFLVSAGFSFADVQISR